MSLLNNLEKIGSPDVMSQIANHYGNLFPFEIRFYLNDFLESKLMWDLILNTFSIDWIYNGFQQSDCSKRGSPKIRRRCQAVPQWICSWTWNKSRCDRGQFSIADENALDGMRSQHAESKSHVGVFSLNQVHLLRAANHRKYSIQRRQWSSSGHTNRAPRHWETRRKHSLL